jgi:hypothetical protein
MPIREAIDNAVAERFNAIKHTFTEREGDYIYGGWRCDPERLGWRFRQVVGGSFSAVVFNPADIRSGKYDKGIEDTWHESASAEHWYRYEKDWGYEYD